MIASALSLSVEFLFLPHRPFNASCTIPTTKTCLGFLLLLPLLVVYQIQHSNVVELHEHYTLSNNTSVTTYIHPMIISQPCLFKHMKNDECVAMVFQCLLDHTQLKLYFCLISLLRNNVSKSVYINFKHSVFCEFTLRISNISM